MEMGIRLNVIFVTFTENGFYKTKFWCEIHSKNDIKNHLKNNMLD